MKIDWKRKLTSRKFWAAVVGFITPTLMAFGVSEAIVTQVVAIVMAGATLIAYILAEGWADAAGAEANALPNVLEASEGITLEVKEK